MPRQRSCSSARPAEQREELELYLDTFRTVAGPEGRLPGDVELVLEDVFADLIQRSR